MSVFVVTGGAGFIGSHLVDALLADGHAVRVIDDLSTGKASQVDKRAELIVGDVGDGALVHGAMSGAAGCFHLAAIASVARCNEDWPETHRVNMGGTVMVFDAARAAGAIPVVYASSAAVYGDQDAERLGESLMPRPRSAYGADKYGAELQGRAAFLVHGVPNIGFRFFNVYGSRQDPKSPYSGVISIFADRLVAGLPLSVHGDGLQTRDFVFVGDIVRFLLAGMEALGGAPRADVFNACTGNATTILHLSEVLGRLLNQRVRLSFGAARPGDIRVSLGDPARARDLLGMAARTTLWEGLRATLANAGAPDRIAEAV